MGKQVVTVVDAFCRYRLRGRIGRRLRPYGRVSARRSSGRNSCAGQEGAWRIQTTWQDNNGGAHGGQEVGHPAGGP